MSHKHRHQNMLGAWLIMSYLLWFKTRNLITINPDSSKYMPRRYRKEHQKQHSRQSRN